jgi:hypothetical protein
MRNSEQICLPCIFETKRRQRIKQRRSGRKNVNSRQICVPRHKKLNKQLNFSIKRQEGKKWAH